MENNIQTISSAIHVIANAVHDKTRLVYHLGSQEMADGRFLNNGKNIYIIYDNIDDEKKEKIGKFIEGIIND